MQLRRTLAPLRFKRHNPECNEKGKRVQRKVWGATGPVSEERIIATETPLVAEADGGPAVPDPSIQCGRP